MGRDGAFNDEGKAIAEVRRSLDRDHRPTLVLFASDGGIKRDEAIARELRSAVTRPVYWQFLGLSEADYGIVAHLARTMDTVGLVTVDDVDLVPDRELYDRLLAGFARSTVAGGARRF
jgi:hypothetical protein